MKCKFEWYGMPCTPDECNFVYCEHNANRVFTVEEELRRSSGRVNNAKLKKGRTFSKPQEKLNRIYEIFEDDMVCAFCDGSWLYNEIAKVIGFDLDS